MEKGLILLSGGLDSYTTAKIAQIDGYKLSAISFSYGQKHVVEIESAKKIAKSLNIQHHLIIDINPAIFQNTSLVNEIEVPVGRDLEKNEIPNTYVPARNILFLTYALSLAESYTIQNIFIGANAVDYSNYPDCRPEFINAFNNMANIGTKLGIEKGITIGTPLINLKKSEIIELGIRYGLDYSLSHSCYNPNDSGLACGLCDSCRLRLKGFSDANITDPSLYEHN